MKSLRSNLRLVGLILLLIAVCLGWRIAVRQKERAIRNIPRTNLEMQIQYNSTMIAAIEDEPTHISDWNRKYVEELKANNTELRKKIDELDR